MSGFIGLIAPGTREGGTALPEGCQEAIAACCGDFSGKWTSGKADLRFGLLKVTDDTFEERLPFSFDQRTRIIGDVRLDRRLELVRALSARFPDLDGSFPDSYILLRAYEAWGEDCVHRIAGDFSFAIWDEQEHSLFCARDHFGIIPFYYAQTENGLVVTNFYRSLEHIPGLMDVLDEEVLKSYFLLSKDGSFDQTLYKNIRKLPPAHTLAYRNGVLTLGRYWKPGDGVKPLRYKTTDEYVAHFTGIFERSVADRLRNSKAASQLSGGMDSSAITAMAEKTLRERYPGGHTLVAYNLAYRHLVKENESYFATRTARHLNISLKQFVAEDYLGKISLTPDSWIPEPVGIPQAVPERAMLADAGAYLKVLLTGFGGDPLFLFDVRSWWNMLRQGHIFRPLTDIFDFIKMHGSRPELGLKRALGNIMKKTQRKAPPVPAWFEPAYISQSYADAKTYPEGMPATTNLGMFHNPIWQNIFEHAHEGFSGGVLKVRFPFFSLELVEFLQALPPHLLHKKYLLRRAMIPWLPDEIVRRQKTPLHGGAHFQNLKSSGVLGELIAALGEEQDFLRGKINIPVLLSEIREHGKMKPGDHKRIISLIYILAWRRLLFRQNMA